MPQSIPLTLGTAKQLLFDDALIEAKEGIYHHHELLPRGPIRPCWRLKSRGSRTAVIIPV